METNKLQISTGLSPNLTNSEYEIVLASKESQIKALSDLQIANKISEVISFAIISLNGFKLGESERELMENQILYLLKSSFQTMTLSEFQKAVFMGTMGNFKNRPEDIIFLSVSNISQWLNKYKSEIKTEAMKKQIQFEAKNNEVDIEAKKKESENITLNNLVIEFNSFLEGKPVYDPVNVLYDFLDTRGMVHITNERKIAIFKECKEKYKSDHKNASSIADHVANRKILQEIENGSDRITAIIKMKAKQKALIEVFQDIKESNMSMNDYLELNGFDTQK